MAPRRRAPAYTPAAEALALVFALLPVDVRLRCREVCTAWRDVLADRSLWTRLDVSPSGGLTRPLATALFAAAVARARSALTHLDVSGCGERIEQSVLLRALVGRRSRRTLQDVRICGLGALGIGWCGLSVRILLSRTPALRVLEADLVVGDICGQAALDARRLLRAQPGACPGAPPGCAVRVRTLFCLLPLDRTVEEEWAAPLHALAADVAAHAPLERLRLMGFFGLRLRRC
jgi:hypothetical protein